MVNAFQGVGNDCLAISDYIIDISILHSDGQLIKYSAENPEHKDMMKALRCSLGLFGIIYEIHVKVYPQKQVIVVNDFDRKVGDLFYNKEELRKLVTSNESIEIFWFPFQSMYMFLPTFICPWKWKAKEDKTWVRTVNGDRGQQSLGLFPKENWKPSMDMFPFCNQPKFNFDLCKHMYKNKEPEKTTMTEAIHYLQHWLYYLNRVILKNVFNLCI